MRTEYEKLLDAFDSRDRPKHFTDYRHCEECAEHDLALSLKDRGSLKFKDVGNLSCTPISFVTIDGFMYYLPALARLALGVDDEYYLDTFLIHMDNEDRRYSLSAKEKLQLGAFLEYVKKKISDSIEANKDTEDLEELIEWLLSS